MPILPTRHLLLLGLLLLLLAGCDVADLAPTPAPVRPIATLFPTAGQVAPPTPAPAQPVPASQPAPASLAPDTGWQTGGQGIEERRIEVADAPGRPPIPLVVVRLDPSQVRLHVSYAPDRPRSLRSWFADGRPLAAINGSFFNQSNHATALLISDGVASGASYEGFGGMLAVAPEGGVSLRPLRDQPYDPDEPLDQALQSFPMLVFPGGSPAELEDDGQRARRSVVALDCSGRLLLIVSPTSGFTLRSLADWLSRSDLDVDRALNLDGGSSTGLFLKAGKLTEEIDSFGPLPIVLLVEPK